MSLELIENTSHIGSGALNDLVFILYCRVIRQWLPTNRQSVGDQLGSDRQPIGDRSATGWRLYLGCLFLIAESLQLFFRSVGNRSATGRRLKTVSGLSTTAATGRRSVANQSATSRQPVGDHQQPFYDRFGRREVLLAATKTSLRPNRPCNHLQPVGDQSPTSLQPPCNLPATTQNFDRKEVADRLQAMCDRGFTGPLCGEFTGHRWIPLTKASDAELWCIFFYLRPKIGWANNRYSGDLRRHRAHYDATIMKQICFETIRIARGNYSLKLMCVHVYTSRIENMYVSFYKQFPGDM